MSNFKKHPVGLLFVSLKANYAILKKMKFLHHKITIIILVATAGLALIVAVLFGVLQWVNSDKMALGLTVAGFKIAGLNEIETKNFLTAQFSQFDQQKITLVFNDRKWQFSPEELGFNFDAEKTFYQASNWGHRANILSGIQEQIKSLLRGKNFSAVLNFDANQFNQTLSKFAPIIEESPQNAKLSFQPGKNDFTILPEAAGLKIDREKLKENLQNNISQLSHQPINLILVASSPQVTSQGLEAVKSQAKELVTSAPYFIKSGELSWTINEQQLSQWVSTLPSSGELTLDQNEIKDFLSSIAPAVNQEPIDVKLTWENNEIKIFMPSKNGTKLNLDASAQKIAQDILNGEKNIDLVLDAVEPEITNENIKELGLTSLLALGESNFAGSPANRKFNIALASAKLNGWLIKPGEEFSFGQAIGTIDEKNGWLPELVIMNKKTMPDYGGGICQVSTTLFRAAVNSGLKVTERHPHAYPVRYYNPVGFDATVYPPSPDLKFINDTPAYLLMQSKIQGTKLTFEIYGTSDGREVKIKGPTITQSNPDGSLKTTLAQEIWRDGQMERQDIFNSSYKSPSLYPVATSTPAKIQ